MAAFRYHPKSLIKMEEVDKYVKNDFLTEAELVNVAESGDILLFE